MKNSDEAIAKVLAGLRDVETPEGMERRILEGMEERVAARRSGWTWLRRIVPVPVDAWRLLLWGAAFAGVVVIGVAVPVVRRLVHAPVAVKISVKGGASLTRGPVAVAANDATAVSQGAKERVAERVRARVAMETRRADVGKVDVAEDSVAVSEMQGASFPAPPMPLTEQERLLLRIAHKGDPVEVAILDPKVRSLQEMKERAEYQRFFARPVVEQPSANGVAAEQQDQRQQKEQQQIPYGDDNQKGDNRSEQTAQQQLNKGEKQ